MTTVRTREEQISTLEGFQIEIRHATSGRRVSGKANGVIGAWPYTKATNGAFTVARWIAEKFEASYPGYTATVIGPDGTKVPGQNRLENLRDWVSRSQDSD